MSYLILDDKIPVIQHWKKKNLKFDFFEYDSKARYEENKKNIGEDWYYYNKKLSYEYNSWGYRCKEFDDIKDKDFALVLGCSNTEGVGLCYEDMWANKLGEKLGIEILNLGMGGTGIDFQTYNTFLIHDYFMKINRFPRFVVHQWPSRYRTTFTKMFYEFGDANMSFELFSGSHLTGKEKNKQWFTDWYINSFLEDGGEMIKQMNFFIMMCNNLWKSSSIEVLNWTWEDDLFSEKTTILMEKANVKKVINEHGDIKARDMAHNGHLSQDCVVNHLIKFLKYGSS